MYTLKWYRVPDFLLSCIPGSNLKELSEGFLFSYKEKTKCVVNGSFHAEVSRTSAKYKA